MIQVNGKSVTLPEHVHVVANLLSHYDLNAKAVIVELNETIVDKSQYENTPIQDGDRVELVHFVGGG
jgi:sulfur carrier protein